MFSGISINLGFNFNAKDNAFSFIFLANITFLFLPEIYMYAPGDITIWEVQCSIALEITNECRIPCWISFLSNTYD